MAGVKGAVRSQRAEEACPRLRECVPGSEVGQRQFCEGQVAAVSPACRGQWAMERRAAQRGRLHLEFGGFA